jgi:hypothetical protein
MPTLRHRLGALLYDWPRFLAAMARPHGWVRFRNRNERLALDPKTGGTRCEWRFTSDLHLANVNPRAGRLLLRRALRDWPIEFATQPRMTGEPRASFVIGHRGEARLSLLLKTIETIAAQDVAVECIVVEQSVSPIAKAHLPDWVRHIHTPIASDTQPYNRSWTLNAGSAAARTQLLVLHDNDFLLPVSYASELSKRHAEGWAFIDLKRFMFYLPEGDSANLDLRNATPERVTQNLCGGGSIAADRDAYFAIGGFDESFAGWGGEDNDFWDRASTRRLFAFAYLPLVHLWHAPQPEKVTADATGGRLRFDEVSRVPAEERIRALLERQNRSK